MYVPGKVAIKLEKLKNLHVAGFNQLGHFVCNGFLAL